MDGQAIFQTTVSPNSILTNIKHAHINRFLQPLKALNTTSLPSPLYHIISGSFRSLSLFLLAFSPIHRTLSLVQSVPAFGPHQYLATNELRDRVYTTSWALPPVLNSWFLATATNTR